MLASKPLPFCDRTFACGNSGVNAQSKRATQSQVPRAAARRYKPSGEKSIRGFQRDIAASVAEVHPNMPAAAQNDYHARGNACQRRCVVLCLDLVCFRVKTATLPESDRCIGMNNGGFLEQRCLMDFPVDAIDRREILQMAAIAGASMIMGEVPVSAKQIPVMDIPAWLSGGAYRRISLNREWRFLRSDASGAEKPDYDDKNWNVVGIPHSFSLPYFRGHLYYVGYGWYRRHIPFNPAWTGQRIFLEFEAAFQEAQVFVNGHLVGGHQGGFTSFRIDVTDVMHSGDNTLAVRVNNRWNPALAPRGGDHIFDGGLYRNVWLVIKSGVHIAYQGLCVTTPQVSHQRAEVHVQVDVDNYHSEPSQCRVESKIIDPSGHQVASMATAETVPGGARNARFSGSVEVANPLIWHPDHPHLYRIETTVFRGADVVDHEVTPLGFRWFEWTAEKGFFLNGQHYWIHGANVHQDHAGWASGATDAGAWRDVRLIKEAGFNFIRTSHYPHSRAFMNACDYYGILVWSEMCFWGAGGKQGPRGTWQSASAYPVQRRYWAAFEKSCLDQLGEMIAMHRNHPSIIVWSMCNEVFNTAPPVFGRMKNLLLAMVHHTHELDPTRPAGIGGAQRGGVDKLGDVAGFNGDGATLYINPGMPNLVTEYGSVACVRPGPFGPNYGYLQRQHYAWRSGAAIWCGFDYGTWIHRTGKMGIIDYFRIPKNSWYWYRQHNNRIPPAPSAVTSRPAKLYLSTDRRVIHGSDAIEDSHILIRVLDADGRLCDAAPTVKLSIVSGPGELPTGRSMTFSARSDIGITAGLAAIEFRSYHAGVTVLKAESHGLKPAYLRIQTTGEPRFIPGVTPTTEPRLYQPVPQPNQLTYLK